MNNPDFVEKTNRAHEVFLENLRLEDASDSDYIYWLSAAAVDLCMTLENTELTDKLTHTNELIETVKKGFDRDNSKHNLSREERDRLTYSESLFTKMFTDESKIVKTPRVLKESEEAVVQESTISRKGQMRVDGKDGGKCTICRKSFKRPKILPCSHVCCLHCLERSGKRTNKNPGDIMTCEKCAQEFKIPKGGFDSLLSFPSSTGYTCGDCAEEYGSDDAAEIPPAVIHCFDCDQYLCAECRRYHTKNNVLKKHNVLDLEDPPKVSAAFEQLKIKDKPDESKASEVEVHSAQALSSKGSLAAASGQPIIERKADHEMMESLHPEGKGLLELNTDYLSSLDIPLSRENIQEQFNNCLLFRTSLYILRERLFKFIKHSFGEFIQAKDLSNNNTSYIRKTIKANVRTTDRFGTSIVSANQRKRRIEALDKSELTADWRTFAMCYMGSFLKSAPFQTKQLNVDYAEPRDLLEIITNCSLFSDELCDAARGVIAHFNRYYAHLSVLLIDTKTMVICILSVKRLTWLISVQPPELKVQDECT